MDFVTLIHLLANNQHNQYSVITEIKFKTLYRNITTDLTTDNNQINHKVIIDLNQIQNNVNVDLFIQ